MLYTHMCENMCTCIHMHVCGCVGGCGGECLCVHAYMHVEGLKLVAHAEKDGNEIR